MGKKTIFKGTIPNDGTGDNLRFGAEKINDNFTELYTALGDGSTLATGTYVTTDSVSTVTNKTFDNSNTFPKITIGDDTSTNFNVGLGESFEITGGTGVSTVITNNRIELSVSNIPTTSLTGTITNAQLAGSISNDKLVSSTIRIGDDTSTNFNVGLGESFEFVGGSGLSTAITNNRMTLSLASVPNSSLQYSNVTLGTSAVSLGSSISSATNFSLDGTSSLSGTGTVNTTGGGNRLRFNVSGFGSLPTASTYEGMFAYDTVGLVPYVADSGGWVRIVTENDSVSRLSDVNITGIADGYILKWSSAQGRFNVAAETGGFTSGTNLDQDNATVQDAAYYSFRSDSNTPTKSLIVTVASQTAEHYYNGTGSTNKYVIDGDQSPFLMLSPGTYRFDQSDSSNAGHPLLFYKDAAKAELYSYNVTTNGTPGSGGAYTQIVVDRFTHEVLYYQCSSHAYMGHALQIIGYNSDGGKSTMTGDGSTTTYTLTRINRTENDIFVFVNGICLVPGDDYTVSGTTLTFTTAPTASAEVVVRYVG